MVYEFSKDFRNEGMSRFTTQVTQVELYVAYKDYEWMMDLVEEMVEKLLLTYMDLQRYKWVKILSISKTLEAFYYV